MFQIIAIIITLGISVVAIAATTKAVRTMLGVMKQGQPALNRTDEPLSRTVTMVKETFVHTRMLQWHWVGVMHWFVYAAFLLLSTAVLAGMVQVFDPEFAFPVFGHFFLYEWASEGLGVLSTIGIVFLIAYRQINHPRRKGRQSRFYGSTQWQAYFVEVMALVEGAAILFIRGAEYNLGQLKGETEKYSGFHFPVSQYFGNLYSTTSETALENTIIAIAMFKVVLAMVWLLVIANNITMGVAWHRFTAWPNIWFKRESSGGTALGAVKPLTSAGKPITLDDIDDLDEEAVLGVGRVEDFSWKGILDFTTCTECGRCQSQCPAWNTEKPLSPKLLITGLRDHAYAKAAGDPAHTERALIGAGEENDWFYNPDGGDFAISEDVLWSCTNCGACVQQCPVDIEHVDHIVDMRRYQVLVESNFPAELNGLFKRMESKGNPWGMSPTDRLDWAKGLEFDVPVVGEDLEDLSSVEWLFWVGCAGAYEDRAKKTTRAVAELLHMADVSFAVLGNGETCTGDSARRAGNEFVFQALAQQNIEVLGEAKATKVVSTCAHCFNALRNEYKQLGLELDVVHHTQLLNRLVREGKLTPVKDGAGAHKRSITYHDPCFIGRHNGVYSPPRELLQVLPGAQVVEMERNSERSFCCGAGGARMWMEENLGSRININRTTEAIETGADQIAVGCPFCRVMLSDGLTAAQDQGTARPEVEVLDVAQMLLASVKGEMATKLAPSSAPAPAAGGGGTATLVKEETTVEAPVAKAAPAPAEVEVEEPVAKAAPAGGSGGGLFDDPSALLGDAPATEAKAAPAGGSGGGSLFDMGGDAPAAPAAPSGGSGGGSLFDLGGEETPAPEAKAAPAAPASGGGSLFDISAPAEEAAPSAEPAPAAEAAPAELAPAAPAESIPSGGSLFDISAPAEAPKAAPAPAAPAAETPAAPAAEAAPASSIPSGGSLFDIAAPEPAAEAPASTIPSGGSLFDIAAPEPAAAAPETSEAAAADPEPEAEAAVVETAEEAPAEEAVAEEAPVEDAPAEEPAAPAAPVSSGEAHQPKTDVDIHGAGSLFDL
ncbi:(Fe-S)-binding protein [Nocardioides sp.]|uniref:(Fe-S)-binding protein n=1 Tax=Nocardioides sp. TaxID=35761 RepID=UPI0035195840